MMKSTTSGGRVLADWIKPPPRSVTRDRQQAQSGVHALVQEVDREPADPQPGFLDDPQAAIRSLFRHDSDVKWISLMFVAALMLIMGYVMFHNVGEWRVETEAIRAGLVQETDDYGNVVWVRERNPLHNLFAIPNQETEGRYERKGSGRYH